MTSTHVLTLSCPDRPGLVFAVTRWIHETGGNILDSQQYTDPSDDPADGTRANGEFFLRLHVDFGPGRDAGALTEGFAPVAAELAMDFRLVEAERPARTLVLVSKEGHCLNDLLYRQSSGGLNIEVPAVVSNHRDLERLASSYDVPFHHLPVTRETKPDVEARVLELVEELDIDLVVLARYMQILSDDLCRALAGRAINIHHSFLPSFKGARPYHQAHDRGVKLIGATAHYVTADLDEGPIIEQGVQRVDHRMSPSDLARVGRDVEAQTLSRAVRLHAESRVLMNGPRTVVFA
ncbi:formyltetrahydrofolate deformylase [Aeromicrobium sp. 50.2.37]|uniref:formyltetrahydrofolate deformylase n=1 Tax=Aeromicrobium sp. 50.2.37 TaxID=2969305 RepID=UPI00214F6241|nr:formyltetrahydrofolate deformylase [Aeromicrobium sp. 50.2.37]MCR4514629.1 formyltetrahydrofolate deformylase [Aeromicrobium sp. 50.2.37]